MDTRALGGKFNRNAVGRLTGRSDVMKEILEQFEGRQVNLRRRPPAMIEQMVVRHCLIICVLFASSLKIFAADDVGCRRHWSDEDKLRIVEESLNGYRQGSATGRR